MTWLLGACVLAAVGLEFGLDARGRAESWHSSTPVLVYVAVVAVLGAVSYLLHRALGRSSSAGARREAALDTVLVAVGGASLLFVVLIAFTIQQCSFGPGC